MADINWSKHRMIALVWLIGVVATVVGLIASEFGATLLLRIAVGIGGVAICVGAAIIFSRFFSAVLHGDLSEIPMAIKKTDLHSAVLGELKNIRALPWQDVCALGPMSRKQKRDAAGVMTINIYHDMLPDGQHRIVVQATRAVALGLWKASVVDGFVQTEDGTRRDLTEQERWN